MADPEAGALVVREACPACGGTSRRTLVDLPYTAPPISDYLIDFYGVGPGGNMLAELADLRYCLLECSHCTMIWQRSAPADDFVERLYDDWIDPVESLDREAAATLDQRVPLLREIISVVAMMDRPPGSLRMLDFGMGWGRWLLIARGLGCQVWGAELSEARLARARTLALPTVCWDEIPSHQFDVINTEQVFEHLIDPYETLVHLSRSLATGGILKISVPPSRDIHRRLDANDWTAPKATRNSLNAVAPLEHLNCYHGDALVVMAERAGLEQVFLPIRAYYRFLTVSGGVRNVAKQLAKPAFRTRSGSYRFFRRPATSSSEPTQNEATSVARSGGAS